MPEELKRKAVVAVASGRLKSREAAAGLGVEASVVGKLETTDARRIQGDARDGDTREEALDGREGKAGVAPMASENMPTSASGPRDTADPSDTLASMEARLARLRARLDELDADVERQRREKKELDIEIAIRKGTLELLGKEPGADPEKPGRPREDAPRQDRWRNAGRDGQKSVARGGHRARHVSLPARRHETPRQGLRSTGARARGVRERQAQVRVQADPLGVEGHGNRGQREADHEALDRARPSAPVQEREAVRLVQGRAGQGPEEPGGRGFPRRTAEHAVGHGPHGVFHPRGQGVPVARDRLLRRHAGRLDDRHDPDSALANGMLADACSTLKDGEKPIIHSDRGCHYRWPEWIRICKEHGLTRSTGAKGCGPDNAAAEGFFGRSKQEFFHKRSFAGVSMDGFINMLDDYMVWYRDRRIKTESGHGHHGPSTQTQSCGMIGGDGINDESNKTAPPPSA